MGHKYSVILCTLASTGGNVWEKPREVLEAVAEAGYDGVDLDAEPDRIEASRFNEVKEMAFSLGLKVPALIGAWAPWHAGKSGTWPPPTKRSGVTAWTMPRRAWTWRPPSRFLPFSRS